MATTDTKVDLVINELSEEQLQALKAAGTVTPNQLWGTPDESLSTIPILLWENSNTAAAFTEQNITLNQSYKNFKYISVIYKFSTLDNLYFIRDYPTTSGYARIDTPSIGTGGVETAIRDITLKTDGNITVGSATLAQGTGTGSTANNRCIPYQIWGLQAISSTIYEDDKVEKVETVYDMNSTDPNVNWGYTSGIRPTTSTGVQINGKSISKYKYLKVYYTRYSTVVTENYGFVSRFIVDLTIAPNSSGYYAGLDTQSVPYVPFVSTVEQSEFSKVYVFLDKQNGNIVFKTAAFDLNAPTTWYYDRFTFTKIEGVY